METLKDYKKQHIVLNNVIQQRLKSHFIKGIMMESNIFSGRQSFSDKLKYGISITDSCISIQETERLLKQTHATI